MNVASAAVECGEIQEWRQVWWKIAAGGHYVTLLDTLSFHKPYPEMREF